MDSEGWLHTGDVGTLLPNGALKIIDRKKNIYKLSQGEYIAPEKIENIYTRHPLVAEIYMYGDSLKSFNVAVVTPNKDEFLKFVKNYSEELSHKSFEELCDDPKIAELVVDKINKEVNKEGGLHSFEIPKKIKLNPLSFAARGLLTPTMKLQRHLAKKIFEDAINELYKKEPAQ